MRYVGRTVSGRLLAFCQAAAVDFDRMTRLLGGRWRVGRSLGEGGQGAVFVATDESGALDGEYALKKLPSKHSRRVYERFGREVDAIKRLSHPGVVSIVDHSGPEGPDHFYVMTFDPEARPLIKVLGTPTSPFVGDALASLNFFEAILEALGACHDADVVHRDLSPWNVLVRPDSRKITIIDFGICQVVGNRTMTLVDEGVGTQNYMAPECEAGDARHITPRADFYSAGKLLWSVVTNERAFARETPAFDGRSLPEMLPRSEETWHLQHILGRTVRNDPNERFANAFHGLEVSRAVRSLVEGRYLPLERLAQGQCPHCGIGKMDRFDGAHVVFGNPNPRGIASCQCSYCGYCAAVNIEGARDALERNKRRH